MHCSNRDDPSKSTFWVETTELLRKAHFISPDEHIDGLGPNDFHSGFNRVRLLSWSVRGMVLAAPDTPVKPWLSFRSEIPNSGMGDGYVDPAGVLDYYQEMIFHFALSGSSR
jgi:hypothetical protein